MTSQNSDTARARQGELIAMLAFLFATVAFSMDAMLPALPQIAAELTPTDVNRAQLVLTSFMAGMGIGTLFAGPISDALGRKRAMAIGITIYLVFSIVAMFAGTLDALLLARFAQGLGAASPRIVGTALVRDLYAGREMARITSFIMMVFMIVPAMAPLIGQGFIHVQGWRGVFIGFFLFGSLGWLWLGLRQEETLAPQDRRPLRLRSLWEGTREVLSDRQVVLSTITMTLGFAQMFALLSSAQQLFGETYGQGERFPLWFAVMALLAATGTLINSRLVMRVGMRRIARTAYLLQIFASAAFLLALWGGLPPLLRFPVFFLWSVGIFTMAGLTFGNLNALAMQRMGHIAGLTASVVAALSTLGAVLIAAPVGLAYDGTAMPVAVAALVCSALAWAMMGLMRG